MLLFTSFSSTRHTLFPSCRRAALFVVKENPKRLASTTVSSMRPLLPWAPTTTAGSSAKAIHLFKCLDQNGVVASISDLINQNGGNMTTCDLFVDADDVAPVFHSRSVFSFDPSTWTHHMLQTDFQRLHKKFDAIRSELYVPALQASPMKLGILCSGLSHCVVELLHRYESNELSCCEITVCVSNHEHRPDSFLRKLLERHNIPFHYVPAQSGDRREDEIRPLVEDTDLLILARYMQILTPDFLSSYNKDIINIHHGLLPSFKGANPYKQAYDSGVKIIGATAHFVTPVLDEGPIVEQLSERVSHRDTLPSFKSRTRALEKQCLFNAVSYYLDHKIMRYSQDRCAIMN